MNVLQYVANLARILVDAAVVTRTQDRIRALEDENGRLTVKLTMAVRDREAWKRQAQESAAAKAEVVEAAVEERHRLKHGGPR